ncbi:MAG: prepilin peptidase [Micavibrio aeruginosavorus]|uniref:Prepilin leader peptidase/N-methyltransferase n=1 Tax=Micavibrio aeruginosavorus TaxID=349221 RepID=A0A7T5UHK5_9BACT|nr:MAG: prepilin peptidase [Micavibrio aeruginosavorus]
MSLFDGWLGLLLAMISGLCLGSFASAVAARVPQGKSWVFSGGQFSRSACMHCGHKLGAFDLVPFFSWLFLKGRCRYCRQAIGWQYPLIELSCLLMAVLVYWGWGFSWASLFIFLAIPFLVSMCVIDLKHMILPDQLNLILAGLGVGHVLISLPPSVSYGVACMGMVIGAAIYAGVIWLMGKIVSWMKQQPALGMGDVKFMAVAGIWMGLSALPLLLMGGGGLGVVLALFWKKISGEERFPFGPALIIAFFVVLLLQSPALKGGFGASP